MKKKLSKYKQFLLGLASVLIGIFLLCNFYRLNFAQPGQQIETAIVVEVIYESGSYRRPAEYNYYVRPVFVDTPFRQLHLSRDTYYIQQYSVGDVVKVAYDKNNPSGTVADVTGIESKLFDSWAIITGLFSILGGIVILRKAYKKRNG